MFQIVACVATESLPLREINEKRYGGSHYEITKTSKTCYENNEHCKNPRQEFVLQIALGVTYCQNLEGLYAGWLLVVPYNLLPESAGYFFSNRFLCEDRIALFTGNERK